MVEMIPLTSSNIVAIGYSELRKLLFVRYKGGQLYQYVDVEQEVFDNALVAASIGSYIATAIKGKYSFSKVDDLALVEAVITDNSALVGEAVRCSDNVYVVYYDIKMSADFAESYIDWTKCSLPEFAIVLPCPSTECRIECINPRFIDSESEYAAILKIVKGLNEVLINHKQI